MTRTLSAVLLCLGLAAPAAAQTQVEGQLRLYIQQLEENVRQLTGQNERLLFEVNQLRGQLGMPPMQMSDLNPNAAGQGFAAAPAPTDGQTLGTLSVSPEGQPIAPDAMGTGTEQPVDLSALAGSPAAPEFGNPVPPGQDNMQTAGLPNPTTSLSGSSRDEYDLAYGYILTGDYDLAEESFNNWLATFPSDPQRADAQFWLGESHLQQGEYREAANAFLAVYKAAPDSTKGPDALMKLGVSLSSLGESQAACATFAEVGRRYPSASQALMNRVNAEASRADC